MNRKKKINSILKKKIKQKNAKLHKSNKPKYISKAEREKMQMAQDGENLNLGNENEQQNTASQSQIDDASPQ
ncbi:MAG: DUF2986 domain-containing protein [Vibrio sp.]